MVGLLANAGRPCVRRWGFRSSGSPGYLTTRLVPWPLRPATVYTGLTLTNAPTSTEFAVNPALARNNFSTFRAGHSFLRCPPTRPTWPASTGDQGAAVTTARRCYKAKLYVRSKHRGKKRDRHEPSGPRQRRGPEPDAKRQNDRQSLIPSNLDAIYRSINGEPGGPADAAATPSPAAVRAAAKLTDELFAKASYLDTRPAEPLTMDTARAFEEGYVPGIDTATAIPTADQLRDDYVGSLTGHDGASGGGGGGAAATTTTTALHDESSALVVSSKASLRMFTRVIYANALAHRPAEAEKVLQLMADYGIQPDLRCYTHLMDAYANLRDLSGVVAVYQRLQAAQLTPDLYVFGTLVKAYTRAQRLNDAFAVYSIMKQRGIRPSAPIFTQLIQAYLATAQFDRAWQIFEHMRIEMSQPDEVAFTLMIHACTMEKKVERAINLFEEMVEAGLTLTDVTFNTLLNACARRRDYYKTAFHVLDQMNSHGIKPDAYTYTALLLACANTGDLMRARRILAEMFAAARSGSAGSPEADGSTTSTDLEPNEVAYSHLFRAYQNAFPHPENVYLIRRGFRNVQRRRAEGTLTRMPMTAKKLALMEPEDLTPEEREVIAQELLAAAKAGADNHPESPVTSTGPSESEETTRAVLPVAAISDDPIRAMGIDLDKPVTSRIDALDEAERVFQYMLVHCPVKKPSPMAAPPTDASATSPTAMPVDDHTQDTAILSPDGRFSGKLFNNYLELLAYHGQVHRALHFYRTIMPQHGIRPHGLTFRTLIVLCSRERQFEEGRKVWAEYQRWVDQVETELHAPRTEPFFRALPLTSSSSSSSLTGSPGNNIIPDPDTATSATIVDASPATPPAEPSKSDATDQLADGTPQITTSTTTADQGNAAEATTTSSSLPAKRPSLASLLAVRSDDEKENLRRLVGHSPHAEFEVYRAMINLTVKCQDLPAAMQLVRTLARTARYGPLTLTPFQHLFNLTVSQQNMAARGELLKLCPPEDKTVRYGLARKWGTTVPWDVGLGKRQVLIEESEMYGDDAPPLT
ncbi:hypothetical protein IWQ60_007542 [Tieghemiomyces parasiticus]|uniref:PROP1-like PPR domain-containing protein n=1 Tax=Tieghemiomyces parasiticus TaxID=78921 RepID=A0A9W8DNS7_9FUNG|nr:hypothetical protein IWQ60_007542 [Tieghemiomyces parasiticus]